jgi:aldose 1-epimerase
LNGDTLHGGAEGLDKKCWQVNSYGTEPFPFVEFSCVSPDGEQGFPGELTCYVRYELNNCREMDIQLKATTDKPTPVNLTTHHYFNLHNGEGTIHDHYLQINASNILEQNKNLVVTGHLLPVEGTLHDLRKTFFLNEGLKTLPEYDQSFVLDKGITSLPEHSATLTADASPWKMELWTTEPVCHFYTGKWIPTVMGKHHENYQPFSGLCLETQIHPNAVNIPTFPETILRPGEIYHQHTIYKMLLEK